MGLNWLCDKSVLGHLHRREVTLAFQAMLDRGEVALSTVTVLEQRVSTRSPDDQRRFDRLIGSRTARVGTIEADVRRASDVQQMLLAAGQHRGPGVADLLVAATAERQGLTVLHLERDFDVIAFHTGQPVRRIAELESRSQPPRPPRGTGIVQRPLPSRPAGPHVTGPHVVCGICRDLVRGPRELAVLWAVDDEGVPLPERLVFAHERCSRDDLLSGYGSRAEGRGWLAQLLRSLGVQEAEEGRFHLSASD